MDLEKIEKFIISMNMVKKSVSFLNKTYISLYIYYLNIPEYNQKAIYSHL
jgi:hypothetical protein